MRILFSVAAGILKGCAAVIAIPAGAAVALLLLAAAILTSEES